MPKRKRPATKHPPAPRLGDHCVVRNGVIPGIDGFTELVVVGHDPDTHAVILREADVPARGATTYHAAADTLTIL